MTDKLSNVLTGEDLKEQETKPAEPAPSEAGKKPDNPNPNQEGQKPKTVEELQAEVDRLTSESKGRLTDLQKIREAKHDLKNKLDEQSQYIEDLQRQIDENDRRNNAQPQKKDPFQGLSDDEPLTVGHVKQLTAITQQEMDEKARQEKESADRIKEAEDNRRRNELWAKTSEQARGEYTAEKQGEGLDFDTVMKRAIEKTRVNKPLFNAVLYSDNPAEDLYNIGLTHPDSVKLLEERGARRITNSLNTNRPKTISTNGGGIPLSANQGTRSEAAELEEALFGKK